VPDPTRERSFRTHSPNPALAGLVAGIYGYSGGTTGMDGLIEPARLIVALILNFGAPYRIALGRSSERADAWLSFVGGLHPGPVWIASGAGAECIQVNLTPLGARRLLRTPADEFSSRLVAIDDLGDPEIAALARRLAEVADWNKRLRLTERFLMSRLLVPGEEDSSAAWALSEIVRRRGRVRIGALTESLGWSRRRLVERFRREFGLSPKTIARIARFEGALSLAAASDTPDWAAIALEAGFADQSHLTREFSDLAGRSPGRAHAAT
jgi:AraC-like DNA-binding protein